MPLSPSVAASRAVFCAKASASPAAAWILVSCSLRAAWLLARSPRVAWVEANCDWKSAGYVRKIYCIMQPKAAAAGAKAAVEKMAVAE